MLKQLTAIVPGGFLLLAAAHTAIGLLDASPVANKIWFFGTGLALATFALLYNDARDRLFNQGMASSGWFWGNLLLIAFSLTACAVMQDASSYAVAGFSSFSLLTGYAAQRNEVRSGRANNCCAVSSKLYS